MHIAQHSFWPLQCTTTTSVHQAAAKRHSFISSSVGHSGESQGHRTHPWVVVPNGTSPTGVDGLVAMTPTAIRHPSKTLVLAAALVGQCPHSIGAHVRRLAVMPLKHASPLANQWQ
jgi:hypothetical protein